MNTYMTELVRYLVAQSWQIAVLAVAVAITTFALGHRSAHIRYLLWLIVLAKCLVPPLYTVPVRILPASGGIPDALAQPERLIGSSAVSTPASAEESAAQVQASPEPVIERQADEQPQSVPGWIGIVWVLGAGAYTITNLLRALRGRHWLRKNRRPLPNDVQVDTGDLLRAYSMRRLPRIWVVEGVGRPFVWGLLRGSIYVPPNFLSIASHEHRRDVLVHELTHILRLDAAVNTLQVFAQAIFWFHPLVWWANRRIRMEREKCCDETAIARLHIEARDYCSAVIDALASMKPSTQPVPSLAVAGPVKHIEERVRTMLRPGRQFYKRPSGVSVTLILLLATLAVPSSLVLTARAAEDASAAKSNTVRSPHLLPEETMLERLKENLGRGFSVDYTDPWEQTILHHISMDGYVKVAEFLIANGADVNARSATGRSPLHIAAGHGYADIVKLLLDNEADVNARDDRGATPLWYAKNGVVYSFELFGRYSKPVMAQWRPENPGCKKAAELLVERGGLDSAPVISLHEAAWAGMTEKVKSLVAQGANVNAMDDWLAATPLHLAACSNEREVVEFLIANGADVNARNRWDQTPLSVAIDQGDAGIAELLRQHGATLAPPAETPTAKVSTSVFKSATPKLAIPERCLEIPNEMQACAANLLKLHAAIRKYEQDKGQLPVWLSDLVPDYVSKEMLLCPDNPEGQVNWQRDPKLPCKYTYEFTLNRTLERYGGGPIQGLTVRDRKIAQLAYFGDVVPLCRCSQHGEKCLNVSVGGTVYVTEPYWEAWIMPDYKSGSELSEKPTK